jgi:hypothetical protein
MLPSVLLIYDAFALAISSAILIIDRTLFKIPVASLFNFPLLDKEEMSLKKFLSFLFLL